MDDREIQFTNINEDAINIQELKDFLASEIALVSELEESDQQKLEDFVSDFDTKIHEQFGVYSKSNLPWPFKSPDHR